MSALQSTPSKPSMFQSNPLVKAWKWWFTPRSTDPDTQFRERCLRWVLFIGFTFSSYLLILAFQSFGTVANFPLESKVLFAMVFTTYIATALLLNSGKVNLAAYVLSSLLMLNVAIDPTLVYWSPQSIIATSILMLFYALILPKNLILFVFVILQAVFYLLHIAFAPGASPITNDSFGNPTSAAVVSGMYFLAGGVVVYFLLREYISQRNQLRELVATLEERVKERTHDLEAAKERAEEADRVKSQFLASMSHELRTPLNAILNFTEMTAIGMLGEVNAQQEDVLRKSLDSGRHLLSLINDVLDITKMHSGMMKMFFEEQVDPLAEVQPVIATAETLVQDKAVKLVLDIDDNLPKIRADKRRVRQVLLNLVSNAAKFTEMGTITISAKNRGDEILFAVIDTGPGIAPDDQRLIFEPFQQTEAGIQHASGTGLGLPISKYLVEAHGGKLWLESEPKEGASFFFTLPVQPVP